MDGSQLGPVPGTPACQPAPPASFPDGWVFIDLAGYAATAAVAPTDALDRLLRRIGVPPSPYLRTPTTARPTFAREAFGESLIGYDEARLGAASPG